MLLLRYDIYGEGGDVLWVSRGDAFATQIAQGFCWQGYGSDRARLMLLQILLCTAHILFV